MGRRSLIRKPNPFASDDVQERVSHRTEASAQIAGERLDAERGGRLQNPVVCPAVVLVVKLNFISGHGADSAILSLGNLTLQSVYGKVGDRLLKSSGQSFSILVRR